MALPVPPGLRGIVILWPAQVAYRLPTVDALLEESYDWFFFLHDLILCLRLRAPLNRETVAAPPFPVLGPKLPLPLGYA